jgi:hypothetical protein
VGLLPAQHCLPQVSDERQGMSQHVSGILYDHSTQIGYLLHLNCCHFSGSQKITTLPSLGYIEKFQFYVGIQWVAKVKNGGIITRLPHMFSRHSA